MRKFIAILATIVVTVAAAGAQESSAGKSDDTTVKMLIANEHSLYQAVAKADKASFQSLVLPEGVWTTMSGFIPLGRLADGLDAFQLQKWGIDNPRVTWTDGNTAILLYVRTGGGTFNGHPFAAVTLASTLWTKRGDKWLAIHHQETDLTRQ
jgi:hypothetical protein